MAISCTNSSSSLSSSASSSILACPASNAAPNTSRMATPRYSSVAAHLRPQHLEDAERQKGFDLHAGTCVLVEDHVLQGHVLRGPLQEDRGQGLLRGIFVEAVHLRHKCPKHRLDIEELLAARRSGSCRGAGDPLVPVLRVPVELRTPDVVGVRADRPADVGGQSILVMRGYVVAIRLCQALCQAIRSGHFDGEGLVLAR
mmetsp:Transcript_47321/g.143890  ORF Transcript_47321/g.143890 Transcript_47321/m.143890 type:complete len:200 (-) Transcript_47321:565-1164(-)